MRREFNAGLADRVAVWIDAETKLFERLEMDWDRPLPPRAGRMLPGHAMRKAVRRIGLIARARPADEFSGGPERWTDASTAAGDFRRLRAGPPRLGHARAGNGTAGTGDGAGDGATDGASQGRPDPQAGDSADRSSGFAEDWFNAGSTPTGRWGEP